MKDIIIPIILFILISMKNMSSIDRIRRDYHDKFDYPEEKPSILNLMNFTTFDIHISSYKLEQKMEDIDKIIKEGKIKDTKIIEQCTKQLNNMKATIDDIYKKKKEDINMSFSFLYPMERKYDFYAEKPEAFETFKRIATSIIKEKIDKLIKYEKIFILFNDICIDLIKKLNINNYDTIIFVISLISFSIVFIAPIFEQTKPSLLIFYPIFIFNYINQYGCSKLKRIVCVDMSPYLRNDG